MASSDHSERHSALLEAVRRSGVFDVRMVRLNAGDYLIDDECEGVGPVLASRLLDRFGSIEHVVSADVSALAEVRGIGPKKAAHQGTGSVTSVCRLVAHDLY